MIKLIKTIRNRIMTTNVAVTRGKNYRNTVVTVLGWAGATERNVEKYSKIYQDKGFTTVQYTAPVFSIGWGTGKTRKVSELAKQLDKVLVDPQKRLIIHLFSMNGVFTLCSLNIQYPELRIFEKCDGLFFDSCPIHTRNGDWRMVEAYSIVMQHVYESTENILVNTGLINVEKVSSYHYLLNNSNLPQIVSFVYSDGDIVCDANMINEFHDKLKDHRDVISKRFKDSLHVEHYRKYPKQYLEQIDEFLLKIERVQRKRSKL